MSKIFPVNNPPADEDDDLAMALQDTLGLGKTKSVDCVQAILSHPQFSNTKPKDWKRKSKRKDPQGNWVRLFENKATGASVEVTETKGGVTIYVIHGAAGGANPGIINPPMGYNGTTLVPLENNGEVDADEWSGRCVFAIDEGGDAEEDGQVSFSCGPEISDEGDTYLSDQEHGGTYNALAEIFSDYEIDIGAAENMHLVTIPQGQTSAHVKAVIIQRLQAAGAVQQNLDDIS